MRWFLFLSFIFFSTAARAEFTHDFRFEQLVGAETANPSKNYLPKNLIAAESRVDLKFGYNPLELDLRPRIDADKLDSQRDAALFLQEAFLKANITQDFFVRIGRINFGWGPAESITPSNWMYPQIQWQPSPYYEQKGLYEDQWNASLGQNISFVFLHELRTLKDEWESKPVTYDSYESRTLEKLEFNWDNSNNILGASFGTEQKSLRSGLYGSKNLNDAWQVYFDAALRQTTQTSPYWRSLSVAGARYTFTDGPEMRAEYIYNQAGPSLASEAGQSPDAALTSLNDQTRGYLYLAGRWSNPSFLPSALKTPTFAIRALESLRDSSVSLRGSIDLGLGDHISGAIYGVWGIGSVDCEMRRLYNSLYGITLKYNF